MTGTDIGFVVMAIALAVFGIMVALSEVADKNNVEKWVCGWCHTSKCREWRGEGRSCQSFL